MLQPYIYARRPCSCVSTMPGEDPTIELHTNWPRYTQYEGLNTRWFSSADYNYVKTIISRTYRGQQGYCLKGFGLSKWYKISFFLRSCWALVNPGQFSCEFDWRWRSKVSASEMAPLLRARQCHHFCCRLFRVWSGKSLIKIAFIEGLK